MFKLQGASNFSNNFPFKCWLRHAFTFVIWHSQLNTTWTLMCAQKKLPTPPQCECQHLSQRTLTEGTIKHKLSIIRGEKNLRELSRTNTLSTLFRIFTPGRGKRIFGVVLRKIFFMPSANWKCQKVAVLFLDRINFAKSHRYRTAVPRSIVELRCNSCEWKSLVILCRSYVQTM